MGKRDLIAYLFLMAFAFIFITCGGGGGKSSDSVAPSPSVASTTPADDTTGASTSGVVTATFGRPVDASTVNAGTFIISKGGSAVVGPVGYDLWTRTATFSSSAPFALVTRYTANLTGVRDLAGNAVNYTWSFTTRDGTWGTAQLIETDKAGGAELPQIADNPSGNANIAVWQQSGAIGMTSGRIGLTEIV